MSDEISLIITNTTTFVQGRLKSEVYQGLKRALGYMPEDAFHRIQRIQLDPDIENKPWLKEYDGHITTVCYNSAKCKCAVKKQGTHFPTGLASKAIAYFKSQYMSCKVYDKRVKVEKNLSLTMDTGEFEDREYQTNAINKSCNVERGIIQAATGSGKTFIGAGIIAQLSVSPFIFYVTSKDLLRQAQDELQRFISYNKSSLEVGIIGDGRCDIRDVNIMTIQTAVRACGMKYRKFDSESKAIKEKGVSEQNKAEIKELITSAKGMIFDECQHVRSDSCQVISNMSLSARYRYGMSATPFRDAGDDILIESCFGKTICNITASDLIRQNYLVKPDIYFVPMSNMRGKGFGTYATAYKEAIVDNPVRNDIIVQVAEQMKDNGRVILVLCTQIAHGKRLEKLIPGSVFIHGKHSTKVRKAHLDKVRAGDASITIASSLPFYELITIKQNDFIKHIPIGEFCESSKYEKLVLDGSISTLCSVDGKGVDWKKVTKLHKHKKQNKILRVITDRREDVFVTENHSLVDYEKRQVKPLVGGLASVPVGKIEKGKIIENINLLYLLQSVSDNSLDVEILDINQALIRKLKSEYKFLCDPMSVSKSTRIRCRKSLKKIKNQDKYKIALEELFKYFKYSKFKRKANLNDVYNLKEIYNYFEARIYVRRSRKKFSLPIRLSMTESFGIICGIMCAEGHIKHQTSPSAKSRYDFVFSALKGNVTDGKHDVDKRNIRNIFKDNFRKVFGDVVFVENEKQIRFNCKLIYLLFKSIRLSLEDGDKTIPDIMYNVKRSVQEAFLWGFYLGDGSKKLDYRKGHKESNVYTSVIMHNSNRRMISSMCLLLKIMELRYYLLFNKAFGNAKRRYSINIVDPFYKLKQTRFVDKLKFNCFKRNQKNVDYIETFDNEEFVYDISVDVAENFIAGVGGILCHNTIFDEGVDVKPLDTLILAGSGKSKTRALQRVGRVLRNSPGKEEATVIDFMDNCKYMMAHSQTRKKIYQTEPEFTIDELKIK
jgi:superfamily II DNA or RNA helicase